MPAPAASAPAAAPLPVHQMQAEAARFDRPEPARENPKNAAALAYAKIAEQSLSEKESEEEDVAAEADDRGFTIGSVAHYLQRHDVPVAIGISPGGDKGSTATVMLAREPRRARPHRRAGRYDRFGHSNRADGGKSETSRHYRSSLRRNRLRRCDPSGPAFRRACHSARCFGSSPRHARCRPSVDDHRCAGRCL